MKSEAGPRLLSIEGAAAFLGVSEWTVRSLVWDGTVPFLQAGRRHMIDREDLIHWVETNKTVNGSGPMACTGKKEPKRPRKSRITQELEAISDAQDK